MSSPVNDESLLLSRKRQVLTEKEKKIETRLDFFQWFAERERRADDPSLTPKQETEWIRGYVAGSAWHRAEHDGDCTNCPYTCDLCALSGLLDDYYEYRFGSAELSRLEQSVVAAAKAYGRANQAVEDYMKQSTEAAVDPADGWQQLRDLESTWEEMLLEAIKPLLEFESQQIKK